LRRHGAFEGPSCEPEFLKLQFPRAVAIRPRAHQTNIKFSRTS
jgi:hypothetical protein